MKYGDKSNQILFFFGTDIAASRLFWHCTMGVGSWGCAARIVYLSQSFERGAIGVLFLNIGGWLSTVHMWVDGVLMFFT